MILGLLALAASAAFTSSAQTAEDFKPYKESDLRLPSVPVIINDPFFSLWSNYDNLNGGPIRHWSEREKAIDGILRVDGKGFRFMGAARTHILQAIAGMTVDGDNWSGRVNYEKQTGVSWAGKNFDDSSWAVEEAAWGTVNEYPYVRNAWTGENKDIYVRRTVNLSAEDLEKDIWVMYSHDDVFDLWINGVRVVKTGETWLQGEEHKLSAFEKSLLSEGDNIIAAHCHNTTGGSYIDFGLYKDVMDPAITIDNAVQTACDVMATSTYYSFTCGPVKLDLVFTAPMLIDDLELISTPINYVSYQVTSTDGAAHDVQFYLGTSAQLTVHEMSQPTKTEVITHNNIRYAKAGSTDQPYLQRTGDMVAIDWGYLYIPALNGNVGVADATLMENTFLTTGALADNASGQESNSRGTMPTMAFCNDLGSVSEARDFMLIGYDEVWDMQYMNNNYKAYYARNGKTIFDAFLEFHDEYTDIMQRCRALDKKIYDDALAAGNKKYAEQLAGTYRLVMGAHKLFQDNTGKILYFSKENKSGGFVNTVDLTYPESPLYLLYNPELQKGMMYSILDYALSPARAGKNCAAHDLGIYPRANGMVYGDSMPLEESANMLILGNAISRITGDYSWLMPYRNVLKIWAEFCRDEGQNPGNQLCTDDFKGHSEQNTNLSVKCILAVAAYGEMLPHLGGSESDGQKFLDKAKDMAILWEWDARDGDHYRMQFNLGGTWSQKYNMVWDNLWGLNYFPEQVVEREVNYYLAKQLRYGVPLDSRDNQTKSDWILWTATLSPDNETFLKFSDTHWKYINETTSRIPLSDYYMADSGRSCNFSGRSVIGGLWMKILKDRITPAPSTAEWEPKGNHIKTRWAEDVTPDNVLPEYPRPILEREDWMNLNGLWNYTICSQNGTPGEFDKKILVPFCIESSLSGVMKPFEADDALWYKREITIPEAWKGKKIILHFGAVDYKADIYMNGTIGRHRIASHTGGHSAFSVDITDKLKDGTGTLYVRVTDSTDPNAQPVGKQRLDPGQGGSIFYTATSGIWQPVWLEPVAEKYITRLNTTPDLDNSKFNFSVKFNSVPEGTVNVKVIDDGTVVGEATVAASAADSIDVVLPTLSLWWPSTPNLYDVEVTVTDGGKIVDEVKSYAGMRKISYAKDENGYVRMQLNNKDFFQFGPLDQGYWPDGLMTAPTDEALAYDLETMKELGFNMIRKHMKVESDRWFYHCDRLGLLVWQDMPASYNTHEWWNTESWYEDHTCTQSAALESAFKNEWEEIIANCYSHPSIVVWTPFNEHWGQFKTQEIVDFTKSLDSSRLINPASGGNHYMTGEGTFVDQHNYSQPVAVYEGVVDPERPLVLGEYGGLGRNIAGHRWYDRDSQTYNTYQSSRTITNAYQKLADQIKGIAQGYESDGKKICYSAAVYTQLTDVETEVNGILTYDRETLKFEKSRFANVTSELSKCLGDYSDIEVAVADKNGNGPVEYYDVTGIRHNGLIPGINIVKEADGTVRKVLVK